MPITEAQKRATMKYLKDKTDELKIRMPKGRKAELQAHAERGGESLNGFINRAADETMLRDNAVSAFTVQSEAKGTAEG